MIRISNKIKTLLAMLSFVQLPSVRLEATHVIPIHRWTSTMCALAALREARRTLVRLRFPRHATAHIAEFHS